MSLLRRGIEKRDYSLSSADPWSIPSNGSLGISNATGMRITQDTALSLIPVYASVRIISDKVSSLPIESAVRSPAKVWIAQENQPPFILSPFYGITRQNGIHQIMVSLLLRGNAFCVVLSRDYLGRPAQLVVVSPDAVSVNQNDDGTLSYKVNRQDIPTSEMVHIRGFTTPGNPLGLSVIDSAKQSIGLGLAAEEFGARFFGSGATPSAVIEVDDTNFSNEQARETKERIESRHAGLRRSHRVAVLSAGAKWKQISVTPDDAQFIATRGFQNADIAMLFGVPPHMLGQVDRTTSWGTGIEQQSIGFLQFTLFPWLIRIEDAFTSMLPRGTNAKFDVDEMLRTDTAGRYAVYMQGRTMGTLTPDEIRAKEGMDPLPNGEGKSAFTPLNSSSTGGDEQTTKPGKLDPGASTPKSNEESGSTP